MTMLKDRSQGFGESVGEIDSSRDVVQRHDLSGSPLLDGDVLNVDVTSSFGRLTGVGEVTAGYIITVDLGRADLLDPVSAMLQMD